MPDAKAGVGFFVTTFNLAIPDNLDVPMSFVFDGGSTATTQPYRAILFVNGWMMGKRVANLGCVQSSIRSDLIVDCCRKQDRKQSFPYMRGFSTIMAESEQSRLYESCYTKFMIIPLTARSLWHCGQWKLTRKSLQP